MKIHLVFCFFFVS